MGWGWGGEAASASVTAAALTLCEELSEDEVRAPLELGERHRGGLALTVPGRGLYCWGVVVVLLLFVVTIVDLRVDVDG